MVNRSLTGQKGRLTEVKLSINIFDNEYVKKIRDALFSICLGNLLNSQLVNERNTA